MGGLCSAACLRHTPLSPSHTQQATRRELQSPCVSACQTFTWRQHSQQNSNTLRARHEAGPRRTPRHGSRAGVVSQTSSGARIRPADLPRSSSFQLNTRSAAAPRASYRRPRMPGGYGHPRLAVVGSRCPRRLEPAPAPGNR